MKAQSIEEYEPKENKCICRPFLFYLKHWKHNIFPAVLYTFLVCMLVCTHYDVPNADTTDILVVCAASYARLSPECAFLGNVGNCMWREADTR